MLLIAEFPHYSSFKAGLQIQSNLFQISFRDNTFRFDLKWSRSLSGAAMCSIKVQISYGSCDKSGRFLRAYNYTHRWCLISIQGGEWLNILRLKNVTHAAHQITEGSERILHFYLICWRQEAQWLQTIYDCDTELNMKWFHCTLPGIKDMSRSRVKSGWLFWSCNAPTPGRLLTTWRGRPPPTLRSQTPPSLPRPHDSHPSAWWWSQGALHGAEENITAWTFSRYSMWTTQIQSVMVRKKRRDEAPLTNTSVKHLSSPTTHSYAASSARVVLLRVRVLTFPLDSMTYLNKKDWKLNRKVCGSNKGQ